MRHLIPVLALLAAPVFADQIDPKDMAVLPPADVLFLGELHDNPWHHENQAAIVQIIAPKAIVFEMLTTQQATQVRGDLLSDQAALENALGWNDSGWPEFAMYYPIFSGSGGAAIYGALVPRTKVRAAIMGKDMAATFGDTAAQYGLTTPLDRDEQAAREADQLAAHCNALPPEMLPGMVQGQRLRDATLAREIERAFRETGGPVVVITGNGHARRDWGAPRLLGLGLTQISIAQFEHAPKGDIPFDYWIITPEMARKDPCLAFQKS